MQRVWSPVMQRTRHSLLILAIVFASFSVVFVSPRPAAAEGLFYKLGCVVSGLLVKSCPQPVKKTEPTPVQTQTPTQQPSSDQPASSESATIVEGQAQPLSTQTFEPLEMSAALTEELPALPVVTNRYVGSSRDIMPSGQRTILANSFDTGMAVLGDSQYGVVASSQGWRIAGVVWYWWVLAVGVLGGLVWLLRLRQRRGSFKHIFSLAKMSGRG